MLPPLLPCCSPGYPSWQLQNQPFLFYIFLAFHPCLPRFPRGVYSYFGVSCAFLSPFRPPQSYSRSPYLRPRPHLRYSPHLRPCPRSHPVFVYGSPPVCVCVCVCVRVCVFIKLHITAQSGLVILVILCHSRCVCVCVCVFIKLHITAQSGPVILVILCHSH